MSQHNPVLEKVSNLIKLSQSPNEEEARTAAMQATRLMAEHQLVLVPRSEIDRFQKVVGEVQALQRKYESEGTQKLVLGAIAGLFLSKQGLV